MRAYAINMEELETMANVNFHSFDLSAFVVFTIHLILLNSFTNLV